MVAGIVVAPMRHLSAPSDSACDERLLPRTVSGVPPSTEPRSGHIEETTNSALYVNVTRLWENCWPFVVTSTRRAPALPDGGMVHSI
jgi:hypothetical protein